MKTYNRRDVFKFGALIAAPMIVPYANLMPVKVMPPLPPVEKILDHRRPIINIFDTAGNLLCRDNVDFIEDGNCITDHVYEAKEAAEVGSYTLEMGDFTFNVPITGTLPVKAKAGDTVTLTGLKLR